MYSVAITGGIASGKTAVTERLASRGIAVVDADLASRAVVEPGQPALAEILGAFGELRDSDGRLDRGKLRALVFADPEARRRLEAITHPRIREWMQRQAELASSAYVVLAIPLLAEVGGRAAYPWLRRIVVIDAPVARQRERLRRRDGADAVMVERLLAAQATRPQRLALADDVLINDGTLDELHRRVDRLDSLLRALAAIR